MWITSSLSTAQTPTVIALGNFDGVHLGHREVICPILADQASQTARSRDYIDHSVLELTDLSLLRGFSDRQAVLTPVAGAPDSVADMPPPTRHDPIPTVVTFFPHPREFFSGQPQPLLTPLDEKALHLKDMGVEQLVLLPFNAQLAALSPEQFVESLLIQQLQAQHISVGIDFRFGRQRAGTVDDLQAIAARHGVSVTVVPLKCQGAGRISSSRIRQALSEGDLAAAEQLLGRPYRLTGQVVQGQQLGRTLGFPTANLKLPTDKFLPRTGVYSVRVYGAEANPQQAVPGVMNLGCRPTVDGRRQSVEVHLLQWSGDLYGQTLTVALDRYLRPEQRFESLQALKAQIGADCQAALASLTVGNPA